MERRASKRVCMHAEDSNKRRQAQETERSERRLPAVKKNPETEGRERIERGGRGKAEEAVS